MEKQMDAQRDESMYGFNDGWIKCIDKLRDLSITMNEMGRRMDDIDQFMQD